MVAAPRITPLQCADVERAREGLCASAAAERDHGDHRRLYCARGDPGDNLGIAACSGRMAQHVPRHRDLHFARLWSDNWSQRWRTTRADLATGLPPSCLGSALMAKQARSFRLRQNAPFRIDWPDARPVHASSVPRARLCSSQLTMS